MQRKREGSIDNDICLKMKVLPFAIVPNLILQISSAFYVDVGAWISEIQLAWLASSLYIDMHRVISKLWINIASCKINLSEIFLIIQIFGRILTVCFFCFCFFKSDFPNLRLLITFLLYSKALGVSRRRTAIFTMLKLYQDVVLILLYAREIWTIYEHDAEMLNHPRKLLKITWKNKISNTNFSSLAGVPNI